ncbi:hypothetical protein [Neobacillus dielmonensis]|uniref:hypothetical protein n=1 Tax=Neobacillus dielmonensis TaxID=1347369 RepID=UPI0012B65F34|nr:hypothetical protein [Neobacillus dielmonensis]
MAGKLDNEQSNEIKFSIWDTRTKENLGLTNDQYEHAMEDNSQDLNATEKPTS